MDSGNNTSQRRWRLYGPSLVTLAVLLPFFSYYIRQVKSQQSYLNDHSFRVLEVVARQFAATVNGDHDTMEAAILLPKQQANLRDDGAGGVSPSSNHGISDQRSALRLIQAYLTTYITHGDIDVSAMPEPPKGESNVERHYVGRAEDSQPFVRLLHENFIDLAKGGRMWVRISAQIYPSKMLARDLSIDSGGVFETIFLAAQSGQVLAQSTNSSVDVAQLQGLLDSRQVHDIIEGNKNAKGSDTMLTGSQASEASAADQRFAVQAAGGDYVLFSVPVPIVFYDSNDKEIQVACFGLIRQDTLDNQALQLPLLGMPAIAIAFAITMAFLWPILKLYTMSDRERLTKSSVLSMCLATIVAAVLLSTLYLTAGFALELRNRSDRTLRDLSDRVIAHFANELRRGMKTSRDVIQTLAHNAGTDPSTGWPNDARFPISLLDNDGSVKRYPFFRHIILTGRKPDPGTTDAGQLERQILKISAATLPTPLVPLPETRFAFVRRLRSSPSEINGQPFVVQSFVSPNTGEFIPSLMFPQSTKSTGDKEHRMNIVLSTSLPSLVHVVFPPGFGFALVNEDGAVEFDSEPSRNLHQDFLAECQDPSELKNALDFNQETFLGLNYNGSSIRAFVRPFEDSSAGVGISKLHLNLIVYCAQDRRDKALKQVAGRFLAGILGAPLLLLIPVIVFILLVRAFRRPANIKYVQRRVWPWQSQRSAYLAEGLWGLFWFLASLPVALFVNAGLVPWILDLFLGICGGGLFRSISGGGLFFTRRLDGFSDRVPLSTAYAARIFGAWLGVLGIFSLLIFQLVVTQTQLNQESADHRSLASAIDNRNERSQRDYDAIWYRPLADASPSDDPVAGISWDEFCQARAALGFDIYDQRAIASSPVYQSLALARKNFPFAPIALKPPPPECPSASVSKIVQNLHYDPAAEFETGALLKSLPGHAAESPRFFSRLSLPFFYLVGAPLLLAIFLWLRMVINRLFVLDFLEPEPLPPLDGSALLARMKQALDKKSGRHDRLLIFAHPQSGSGIVLDQVVDQLKTAKAAPHRFSILDCAKIASAGTESAEPISQAVADANAARLAILDNFEVQITDTDQRLNRLALLEGLVSTHQSSVYVLSSCDPLLLVQSLIKFTYTDALRSELDRWTRVLSNFDRCIFDDATPEYFQAITMFVIKLEEQGLGAEQEDELRGIFREELSPTVFLRRHALLVDIDKLRFTTPHQFEETLVSQVRAFADCYYGALWLNCTSDERLALYQLAKDDWLNPRNKVAISHLLRKQLITKGALSEKGHPAEGFHYQQKKEGAYRLMNLSFRVFVLNTVTDWELGLWAKQQNLSLWPALRMAFVLTLVLVALFIGYVRRDVFDVYFSYIAAIAGGGAALIRLAVQFFTKEDPQIASALGVGKKESSASD